MKQSMPVPVSCTLPQKNEGCIETLIQLKITLATGVVARVISIKGEFYLNIIRRSCHT